MGRKLRADIDRNKWAIGDLAAYITLHAEDEAQTLTAYSTEIDLKYKTLAGYRKVATFYDVSTRADFMERNKRLTWTHYRDAMRFDDLDRAYQFLEHAASEGWTTAQAERELVLQLGKAIVTGKVFDEVVTVRRHGDFVIFKCAVPITANAAYRVTISEA